MDIGSDARRLGLLGLPLRSESACFASRPEGVVMTKSDVSLHLAAAGVLLALHVTPVLVLVYLIGLLVGYAGRDHDGTVRSAQRGRKHSP
jgi:hypothetical protein